MGRAGSGLFLQALVAFLALPGVVAFAVPYLLVRPSLPVGNPSWPGLIVLGAGLLILGRCVRDFYVAGAGTLAPWAPPQRLVVTGLYRFSRNPMYLGVLCIVAGWAIVFRSSTMGWYATGLLALFHLRVVLGEEPYLARAHGAEWEAYRSSVPRWLGRVRAGKGG